MDLFWNLNSAGGSRVMENQAYGLMGFSTPGTLQMPPPTNSLPAPPPAAKDWTKDIIIGLLILLVLIFLMKKK